MWLSVVAIILLAFLAYYLAFALIEDIKELFLKAGMFGKDLNKNDDSKMYASKQQNLYKCNVMKLLMPIHIAEPVHACVHI